MEWQLKHKLRRALIRLSVAGHVRAIRDPSIRMQSVEPPADPQGETIDDLLDVLRANAQIHPDEIDRWTALATDGGPDVATDAFLT